jgi:effector-binding domain-containing protein
LFKNIVINHNKVINFVSKDLGKKDDEFGEPVLLTEAGSYKNKEVSYFYGVPLSKRVGITDNNFSFRTINPSQNYVIYFKGNYDAREKAITALLQKAKKDSMRNGTLEEMFVNPPSEGEPSILKLSLPVYR